MHGAMQKRHPVSDATRANLSLKQAVILQSIYNKMPAKQAAERYWNGSGLRWGAGPEICSRSDETFLQRRSSIQVQSVTRLLWVRFRKNPAVAAAGL